MKNLMSIAFMALILALTAGSGCKTMTFQEREATIEAKKEKQRLASLNKLKNLRDGELYIVGKVVLIPSLKEEEQNINTMGTPTINHIMAFFSGRRVNPLNLSVGMMKDIVNVELGETFIAKRRVADPIIYSGGTITMATRLRNSGGMLGNTSGMTIVDTDRLLIPGGYSYQISKDTKALYVGTIEIHRDKQNNIVKTTVKNDYKFASAHFKKTLGTNAELLYVKPTKLNPL